MGRFKLAIGLHNHQPVGNFDFVFEDAHNTAYKPFLNLLENYPNFRISLHQSGILWDYQEKNHPEYLEKVKQLCKQGRVEILGGGFFEPILSSIPERDIVEQYRLLSEYINDKFNQRTNGSWLTERIWEPHLPKVLNKCGIKYLPVDDTHFIYAGIDESQLTGPFITEHEGYSVKLLPISKKLRYLIPFGTVDNLIGFLKSEAEINPDGCIVYADDGEKFGVWPKTHQHCFEDGWLKSFFDAVEKNSDWLEIVPLSDAASQPIVGKAYLPTASYAEMLHWALPVDAYREYENFENYLKESDQVERFGRFVRGGHWRGFLAKYEEVNLMHKKMLFVSDKIQKCNPSEPKRKLELEKAKQRLYAGQCNCPYWHGVFGGLYLPHIRSAIFSNLVEAQQIVNKLNDDSFKIEIDDYDCDGYDEIIFGNKHYEAVFKPNNGGILCELSYLPNPFNLTDTLMRRKEGYHNQLENAVTPDQSDDTVSIHDQALAKESGLDKLLTSDRYLKRCFIDHIFEDNVNFNLFDSNDFNLELNLYKCNYNYQKTKDRLILGYKGRIYRNDQPIDITIIKIFSLKDNRINVQYNLKASQPVDINFGIENNFNFQAGLAEDRFILIDNKRHDNNYLSSKGSYNDVESFSMIDQYRNLGVKLNCDQKSEIWHTPIYTVSLSEGGFEKVYQGTTFVNRFKLSLSQQATTLNFSMITGSEEKIG